MHPAWLCLMNLTVRNSFYRPSMHLVPMYADDMTDGFPELEIAGQMLLRSMDADGSATSGFE